MNKMEPIYFAPEKKVTGGWLLFKSSPSPPPAPDYTGAAQATAAGNLDAARTAASANKVNQVTPYGNLTYSTNGNDPYGNAMYTATQSLAPAQQGILNSTNSLNQGLTDTANTGLQYANGVLSKPGVDTTQLAQTGINPGQSMTDAMMARNAPQMQRENQANDQMLANQGIGVGSEAYKNSKDILNKSHNDLTNQATVAGMNTGMQANQQGFQQQAYNQMQPINVINALRSGSQVSGPQFANIPQQANAGGADLLGAAQARNASQMQGYNSQVGAANSFNSGLFQLGAAAMPYVVAASDRRLKRNIKRIGTHALGIGLYTWNYIWGEPSTGVMADEVETVMPEAVIKHPLGFKMVDYSMLGV